LKTLLQREQLLETERRKEAERKLLQQQEQKQKSETNKVPLQVDVPPQVLQVNLIITKFVRNLNLIIILLN
jgi:hypothetical protein